MSKNSKTYGFILAGLIAGLFAGAAVGKRRAVPEPQVQATTTHSTAPNAEPRYVSSIEFFPGAPSSKANLPADPDGAIPLDLNAHAANLKHAGAAFLDQWIPDRSFLMWRAKFSNKADAARWLDGHIHSEVVPGTNLIDVWVDGDKQFDDLLGYEVANHYCGQVTNSVRTAKTRHVVILKEQDMQVERQLSANEEKLRKLIAAKSGTPQEIADLRERIIADQRQLLFISKEILQFTDPILGLPLYSSLLPQK